MTDNNIKEIENVQEEETEKTNVDLNEETNGLNSIEAKDTDEDPRRKRRRSSASSET